LLWFVIDTGADTTAAHGKNGKGDFDGLVIKTMHLNQKLIRGLKRVAWLYAPEYSN